MFQLKEYVMTHSTNLVFFTQLLLSIVQNIIIYVYTHTLHMVLYTNAICTHSLRTLTGCRAIGITHRTVAAYGSGITESSPYHELIFYFVIFYIPTTYKYFELKEQTFHTPISALFLDQEQSFLEVTMTIVTAVGKRTNNNNTHGGTPVLL